MSARFNPLVAVLLYDGLCTFEFSCATEVFALPRPELEPDWYRFRTCASRRRSLRGRHGMRIDADTGLDGLREAGMIIVPGWAGIDVPVPAAVVTALCDAHARGARLVSLCSGAFVLAATGLLDGRRATTHWAYAETLQRRHPRIRVEADVLYVDEDSLMTSAGSAAALDLCLHLVRRDFGPGTANHVARRLVVPPHRDGGQAQFVERPVQRQDRDSLSPLLDNLQQRLHETLTIACLAGMAAMSERTFMRRFKAATGSTPMDWLTAARVDRARELLESGDLRIDRIADLVGLGGAAVLRHHFRRRIGISPGDYRRRFRSA